MTMTKTEVDQAFERDVPQEQWENIRVLMCESAHDADYKDERIQIIDRDRMDACNVRVEGVLTINDREFWFILESGNWNGDVLLGWEDTGLQTFEHHKPTVWALAPNWGVVNDAIASGKGPFLIHKWDGLLKRADVAEIPRKYSYDKHFQPGVLTETYWRKEAEKYGFRIVEEECATDIRARLASAIVPLEPSP